MGTSAFNRGRRIAGPQLPRGDLLLESPPQIPQNPKGQGWKTVLLMLPMVAGAGAMAMMMVSMSGSRGILGSLMGGLYAISMLGMLFTQTGRSHDDQAIELDAARRDYFRYLGQMRRRVRETAREQRAATLWIHPDPDALWTLAGSKRMWERRPEHEDFGSIRVALGVQNFAQRITPPESRPIEDLEPLTVGALRRFMSLHRRVPAMPISLDVPSYRSILLFDDHAARGAHRELAYAMVAQIAMWHAPTDFRILICVAPHLESAWDWVKWLPHVQHPVAQDAVGPTRLVANTADELAQLASGAIGGLEGESPRHVVVIVDGVSGVYAGQFAAPGTTTTTIHISSDRLKAPDRPNAPDQAVGETRIPRRMDHSTVALEITDGSLTVHMRRGTTVERSVIGPADRLTLASAEIFARQVAPYRMPSMRPDDEADAGPVEPADFPTMLGVGDPVRLDASRAWRPRAPHQRLRIPIGVGVDGHPVELDIKEAAMHGMGPHGLCIGATGSGKSEFLRTLTLGLAMTHPPDQLNFVLVDFKGGATFAGLEDLPHVSAVITNLESELALVDRMQDAIGGELDRRMEVLSATNAQLRQRDIKNREEYEAARADGVRLADGAAIPPMPSLFIVVDEFSELLTARPEFIDLFIQIGRIGRSIGVHLLLASQRLEESKLRGLDSYLSYRIALRTFSAMESRTVIGVADAYSLPSAPGHAYLKFDTTNMVQFKAAYVSGPWDASADRLPSGGDSAGASAASGLRHQVMPLLEFTARQVAPPTLAPESVPSAAMTASGPVPDNPEARSLLNIAVERLRGRGWPAHRVWLPPLDVPATLDQVLPADPGVRGRLCTPVALVDRPRQQRRDPMWIDFSGAAGHLGIVGGPQAGKSTAVRAVIAGLALTHTPQQVGFYCLDFGGGSLASLRDLPHVGSVCGRLDVNRVKRTVAELTSALNARELAFSQLGIESMAAYRRARLSGQIPPDRFASDVFLVVDGWLTLRQDFEDLEPVVTRLAERGLSFGIHVIASANKWSDYRLHLRDLLLSRVELKLGDAFESEIDRKLAALVPAGRPGRGLSRDGLHMQIALPRIDRRTDLDSLGEGVRDLVASVKAGWNGPEAAPVRLLPQLLGPDQIPKVTFGPPERAWPIGVDELELDPVWFDPVTEPHLIAYGAPKCGKSSLIQTMLQGIRSRYAPDEAKVLLIDYRRAQLGVLPEEYLLGYCASAQAATATARDVAGAVRERLPGPEVTQEQLRTRSWWHGLEVFVVVDDYELVATTMGNPLQPFFDLVSQASDIGLHIFLARGMGGAGRAGYSDQIIARMRDGQHPGLIMSGPRDEGVLLGDVKPTAQPPGRGYWVTRAGTVLIQTVHNPRPEF